MKHLATIGLTLMLATPAWGLTLFDQGPPDRTSGGSVNSNLNHPSTQQIADDFVFSFDATLTGISWAGYYQSPSFDPGTSVDFTIRLFEHDGTDLPLETPFDEVVVSANVTTDGVTIGPRPLYRFSANRAGVTLSASERFWLSILESDVSTGSTWAWHIAETDAADALPGYGFRLGDTDWNSTGMSSEPPPGMTFTRDGVALPEPSTSTLFLVGIVVMARSRRRGVHARPDRRAHGRHRLCGRRRACSRVMS